MRASALWLALLAAGCFDGPTLDDEPCPPGGTPLTYDTFGREFFGIHCQICHADAAPSRHGAPTNVVFDTVGQIRERAARIYERAASSNTSMPPGLDDDPPAEARDQLAEWLACGAP